MEPNHAASTDTPKVVEAVGTAVSAAGSGGRSLAARFEAAMVAATQACADEGIIDPDVIRDRKMEAYAAEKEVARAEAEAAASAAQFQESNE